VRIPPKRRNLDGCERYSGEKIATTAQQLFTPPPHKRPGRTLSYLITAYRDLTLLNRRVPVENHFIVPRTGVWV